MTKKKNMAKVKPYLLSKEIKEKLLNEFFGAVAGLKDFREVKDFFKDLLSESESVMLARRLQVAKMLLAGASFQEIREKLGVGFDNINTVSRWLRGGRNGYLKAIERVEKLTSNRFKNKISPEEKANPFSWYRIKKRYPLYFWPEELVGKIEELVSDYIKQTKKKRSLKKQLKNLK